MIGKLSCLVFLLSLPLLSQPFQYSPNPLIGLPNSGNAIVYQHIQTYQDGYGNHWLETFILPRIANMPVLGVTGEGIFHIFTFLDFNVTYDPLPSNPFPLVFGQLDEHIFSPHSIQLTSNVIQSGNYLSPVGWTMYFPVAYVEPYPQMDPDYLSCSFHIEPIIFLGLPQILTSRTLIPPVYHGLQFSIQLHSVANFYSEAFGSGWGVITTQFWIVL